MQPFDSMLSDWHASFGENHSMERTDSPQLKCISRQSSATGRLNCKPYFVYAHPESITPTFKNAKHEATGVVVSQNGAVFGMATMDYFRYWNLQGRRATRRDYPDEISGPYSHPIPILNFKENVVMQHHLTANSISTLVLDAPIPYGAGKIEWFDLGANKTLITHPRGVWTSPKAFSAILNPFQRNLLAPTLFY